MVQPITGTFTGTFTLNGATITISTDLLQGGPKAKGPLGLSGSASFTNGTTCGLSTGGIFDPGEASVIGTGVGFAMSSLGILTPDGLPAFSYGGTATDGTAKTIQGMFRIGFGPCAGQSAPLVLTRQ